MIQLIRSTSEHQDFVKLVSELDRELAERDGADHAFFAQFNKIDKIKHVVLAYEDKEVIACGAIKAFDESSMEVKRMYSRKENRGQGLASQVLNELEKWANELG